jgi:hypothetical protein
VSIDIDVVDVDSVDMLSVKSKSFDIYNIRIKVKLNKIIKFLVSNDL